MQIAERENNLPQIAENAKLLNNRGKELSALRLLFQTKETDKQYIVRYLEVADRVELERLSKQNSPHQLQLINFLIKKGEKKFVHQAITNSDLPEAWKVSPKCRKFIDFKEFEKLMNVIFVTR